MSPLRPGTRSGGKKRVAPGRSDRPGLPDAVIWHDVECGSYTADLPAWEGLAQRARGPILELGAGTGRVALALGARGVVISVVEHDRELAAELERRAMATGVGLTVHHVDACSMELRVRYAGIIAPMQFVQSVEPSRRRALLEAITAHLRPGGLFAAAIVVRSALTAPAASADVRAAPPVDIREVDGWLYSSRPLWVSADHELLTVTRERERVSPAGEIEQSIHRDSLATISAEQCERELRANGLAPIERIEIDNGPGEADSLLIVAQLSSQPPPPASQPPPEGEPAPPPRHRDGR